MINKNKKVIKSFIWKFAERASIQVSKFIVQLFLARILLPDEYGLVAIITVFISIADIVVQSGLNTALVQRKNTENIDYSTVLLASIALGIISYFLLFLLSPYIAYWYGESQISLLLRILGVNLLIGSIYSVQIAYISKNLNFRANFISSLVATIISGMLGIIMAILGFGIWAMIVQQIINQLISVLILCFYTKKIFLIKFSLERLKILFSYGWKVMISSIIATLTENMYNATLGKLYDIRTVGYYNRGHQFPTVLCSSANATITSVFLPVMASEQDEKEQVKYITRKGVQNTCFFIFPMICGLFAIAEPMVKVVLTDKWLPSVPFLRLECLYYLTLPIIYVQGQATKAIGRSGIYLATETAKFALTIICILLFKSINIYYLVAFRILISLVMLIIQVFINKALINYQWNEIFSDIKKSLVSAIIMGIIVFFLQDLKAPEFFILIIQILSGTVIFIFMSIITKNQILQDAIKYFRR